MLHPKVGGLWLGNIGPFGPVTVVFGEHGLDSATWEMDEGTFHPALRGNAAVTVYDGGFPIGTATLLEPGGDGKFAATGVWKQAENAPCLDAGGVPTTVPDTAIAQAYARGEISWTISSSISSTGWAPASTAEMSLAQLLGGFTAEQGTRWSVSPTNIVTHAVDPTAPLWIVPNAAAERGLTPSEDEFYSHIVGIYLSGASTIASVTVGSAEAAAVFGRRTATVDLTDMGVITGARATSVITGMLLRSGARMGWREGLDLAAGQITNTGGYAATLSQIQAGHAVQLSGVIDTSRASLLPSNTLVVIATSTYTDGSDRIALTPQGYSPRNFADVFKVTVEDAA